MFFLFQLMHARSRLQAGSEISLFRRVLKAAYGQLLLVYT